jgi:hypothetical protein
MSTAENVTPEGVLARALEAARRRITDLSAGADAMRVAGLNVDTPLSGASVAWFAGQFIAAAREALTDLDHAERASEGGLYADSPHRYPAPADADDEAEEAA